MRTRFRTGLATLAGAAQAGLATDRPQRDEAGA